MSSPETSHQIELERRCRVCAGILGTKSSPCSEEKNRELLKKFGITVEQDRPDVHPTQLCLNCRSKAVQYSDRVNSSLVVFEWTPHTQDCEVCSFFSRQKKGGRPKKERKNRGRPKADSVQGVVQRMARTDLPSYRVSCALSIDRFLPSSTIPLKDLQCSLCGNIVDQPVQTPCRKLVCTSCVIHLLRSCNLSSYPCPSCKEAHTIDKASFPEATTVVMGMLGDLLVKCDKVKCTQVVALKHLRRHLASGCSETAPTFSPSKLTVAQILSRPLTSPPTSVERKAATSVVKRIMNTPLPGSSCTVKLPTSGQVRYIYT